MGLGGGEAKWVVLDRPSGPWWWRGHVGLVGGGKAKWALVVERPSWPRWRRDQVGLGVREI